MFKNKNMKYAKTTETGTTIWNSKTQIPRELAPQYASDSTLETLEIFKVIEPIKTQFQKLVNIHFVKSDKVFTYDVEDFAQEEIKEIETDEINRLLKNVLSKTLNFARAILMGKTIDDDLEYYENVYKSKYNACKSTAFDQLLSMELATESIEGITTLSEYKAYVIGKYELGQGANEQVKAMVEVFRKTVLKDVANENFTLANSRITELDNLPSDINPTQFGAEFTRIITL